MRSMTGYAKHSFESERFSIVLEIKSVNNKNFSFKIKLPHVLNSLENEIRTKVASFVSRGSVEMRLDLVDKEENLVEVSYDKMLANMAMQLLKNMENDFEEKIDNKMNILINNFSVINKRDSEIDIDEYRDFIDSHLEIVIEDFIRTKRQEGERLRKVFLEKLEILRQNLEEIKKLRPSVVERYKNKLLENVRSIESDIDFSEEDILKEIMIFSDRVDISEELTRLSSHLEQLGIELSKNEISIGKKIEFILQEIFRELNTTGVKSNMYEISSLVVNSKNELEKMREQIMNIE